MAKKQKKNTNRSNLLFGEPTEAREMLIESLKDSAGHQPAGGFWSSLGRGERLAAVAVCLLLAMGALGAGLGGKIVSVFTAGESRNSQSGSDPSGRNNGSLPAALNPFAAPPAPAMPAGTPQLSKEYIYAGSRLLVAEDANASASPPTDLAVWRPSTGYWYVYGGPGSQQTSVQFGGIVNGSTDVPVPGDFDGDGKTDFSVFRPSNGRWYVQSSSSGALIEYQFGQSGDQMAPADWDGDGKTDAGLFRNGAWYVQRSSDSTLMALNFGYGTDTPVPADFDGDGKADIAVWRNSDAKFYVLPSSTNYNPAYIQTITYGQTGDVPVVGDFDGDGKADAGIWRGSGPAQYQWQIRYSSDLTTHAYTMGDPLSDKAVQNDYDGDGKVDVAIWRPSNGTWYIVQSTNGATRSQQWGQAGDIPVPAFYRR